MAEFPLDTRNAVPSTGGTQTATFPGNISARYIDRVNISGPAGSVATLYVGGLNQVFQRDGTNSGAGDTAEYPNGLFVPAGNPVYVVWSISNPSASATVQWRKV